MAMLCRFVDKPRSNHVFINCPFDEGYKPVLDGIVFAVTDLGFVARSAREHDDAGEVRLSKIERIIEECKYGIHDLSAVELDPLNHLPRFNMPLELGLFLGCRRFGMDAQRRKIALIMDAEPYRYQRFISDIAGQDIHAHGGQPERAIREVRQWLAIASKRKGLPGGADIVNRYKRFRSDLPAICAAARLQDDELTFSDLRQMMVEWLGANR